MVILPEQSRHPKKFNKGVADSNKWTGIENCSWLTVLKTNVKFKTTASSLFMLDLILFLLNNCIFKNYSMLNW